jgi:hypothetical protein
VLASTRLEWRPWDGANPWPAPPQQPQPEEQDA